MTLETKSRQDKLSDALKHLQLALELLDEVSAPAEIGAHIDLAAHQLGSLLVAEVKVSASEEGVAHH